MTLPPAATSTDPDGDTGVADGEGGARPRSVGVLIAGLVAAGLGIAVTMQLWLDPSGRMVSGNIPDATHYSWWLAHTPYAILHGTDPFTTTVLNWPTGVGTMNNTTLLLPSIVLYPITWLFGSLATLNVLTVLSVPACIAAAYWALRQVDVVHNRSGEQVGRSVALAGATVYGISPAIVNSLVGHVTMSFAPGLPILLVLGVRAWLDPRPWRTGLWLGLAATVQVFIGEEVLFQAGLGSLIILLTVAGSRPAAIADGARRLVRSLGVAVAVLLVLAGYGLYQQFFGPLRQHGSPFLPGYFGADVTAFYTTSDRQLLHTDAGALATAFFPGGIEEHLAYLGVPLLVACLIVAVTGWRRLAVRCAALGMVISMALSLGGKIWIGGRQHDLPGPYALLENLPVTEASLATRLGLLAAVFAGTLLALGLQQLLVPAVPLPARPSMGRGVLAGLIALACLAPLVPRQLPTEPARPIPEYFTGAARDLDQRPVLVLPYPTAVDPVAMRWQVAADFAFTMPGGYFLGPGPDRKAYVGGGADPVLATVLNDVARTGQPAVVTPQLRAQAKADLTALGVVRIVLGPTTGSPVLSPVGTDALRTTLTDLLGQLPEQDGGVDIWVDPLMMLT